MKSGTLNHHKIREFILKMIVIDELPLDLLKMWDLGN